MNQERGASFDVCDNIRRQSGSFERLHVAWEALIMDQINWFLTVLFSTNKNERYQIVQSGW